MKKIIILVTLIVLLMSGFAYAQIGGEVGTKYISLREQLEWTVGVNYSGEKGEIGFRLHTYTSMPLNSDTPPFVGFAPQSSLYTWYIEYKVTKQIKLEIDRYCEHWTVQSDEYNDYVGYSIGIKYEF